MRLRMLALTFAGLVGGCSGSAPPVERQLEYNFTVAADRAKWKPEGLDYLGSVGPYAVYRVTASEQRLVGPRVAIPRGLTGVAMIQGAKNYFSTSARSASAVLLSLRAGSGGEQLLCQHTQPPADEGSCTPPSDQTGSTPAPSMPGDGGDMASGWGSACSQDGGTSSHGGGGYGGSKGGGAGSGWGNGSGSNSGGYSNPGGWGNGGWNNNGCGDSDGGTGGGGNSDLGTSGGGDSDGGSGSDVDGGGPSDSDVGTDVAATFEHPAQVGSTVLLRKIVISGTLEARGQTSVPGICCHAGQCSLDSLSQPIQ